MELKEDSDGNLRWTNDSMCKEKCIPELQTEKPEKRVEKLSEREALIKCEKASNEGFIDPETLSEEDLNNMEELDDLIQRSRDYYGTRQIQSIKI